MSDLIADAFDLSPFPQCVTTPDGRIVQANAALKHWYSHAPEGQTCLLWDAKLQGDILVRLVCDAVTGKGSWSGEMQYRNKQTPLPVQVSIIRYPNATHWLVIMQDLSLRKQAELRLQKMAYMDGLTQLASAGLLADRCAQAIARAKRANHLLMLILLQPAEGHRLRETLGTDAGDRMIQALGLRLVKQIRHEDTLAHLGQGRFALLVPDLKGKSQAVNAFDLLTDKLQRAAAEPLPGLDTGFELQQGAALWPADADDATTLQHKAEQAMHNASARPCLFTPALQQRVSDRRAAAQAIHTGLQQRQFVLHYQPLLDTDTGEVVSLEALVRWQHPDRGLLLPAEFIAEAQATGHMPALGQWILREAARQILGWQQQAPSLSAVHVNLTPEQFRSRQLIGQVRDLLADTGLPAEALCLEFTEQALNWADAAGRVDELHLMGVQLSLDDYGAGQSAIADIAAMPLSQIKLHRRFVSPIPDPVAEQRLSGIAAMIRALGKRLVICGIENPRQLELAQQLGCERVQGFLLAEPLPAEQVAARLSASFGA